MDEKYINELLSYLQDYKKQIDFSEIIDYYLLKEKEMLEKMNKRQLSRLLISGFNYKLRNEFKSSELLGFKVKVGDICYIDFGSAYISEAGFQHFGLIIGYNNSKALIVPMSSNVSMYNQSYCPKNFSNGKKHLYRLPEIKGLHKKSVLFLNDIKSINTARVIDIKGYINPNSQLFKDVISRIIVGFKHN